MMDLAKYPWLTAMLARRNPDRKPVAPTAKPPAPYYGLFRHFAHDAGKQANLQYATENAAILPF